MEPWKRNPSVIAGKKTVTLQWGHGDGAVEESPWTPGTPAAAVASMGPRRWSRGRVILREFSLLPFEGFNGATAMEPWKS